MQPLPVHDRSASIAAITGDPPEVHDGAPGGVWGTATGCYEFIAQHLPADASTLETGLGMSTLMFAEWSRRHVCVVGSADQVAALEAHCSQRAMSIDHVEFAVGSSDDVLPSLQLEMIDLFLIDGGHGFPLPIIDWYYGSRALRSGGIVVVDDIQLPSVEQFLVRFLDADPRWVRVGGDGKWVAFRKTGDFSLREEWTEQPFLGKRQLPMSTRLKVGVRRIENAVRGRAGRAER